MAKRWVHLYQAHGEGGLAKKFTSFSAEVNHLRMEVAYLKKLRALVQQQRPVRTSPRKKRK